MVSVKNVDPVGHLINAVIGKVGPSTKISGKRNLSVRMLDLRGDFLNTRKADAIALFDRQRVVAWLQRYVCPPLHIFRL